MPPEHPLQSPPEPPPAASPHTRANHTPTPPDSPANGSARAASPTPPVHGGAPTRVALQSGFLDFIASLSRAERRDLAKQPPNAEPGFRQYDAVLVTAGRIQRDDGEPSDWLIPPHVLEQAVLRGCFQAVPHYVDHPDRFGFGWRQSPSVRDLAGVVTNPHFNGTSVVATIRLYDTEAGQLLGTLYDQILADMEAGRDVPPIGLSLVCFRQYEQDDDTGLRTWTLISKICSVDAVYEPGAAGYIRAALSTIAAERDRASDGTLAECPPSGHSAVSEATAAGYIRAALSTVHASSNRTNPPAVADEGSNCQAEPGPAKPTSGRPLGRSAIRAALSTLRLPSLAPDGSVIRRPPEGDPISPAPEYEPHITLHPPAPDVHRPPSIVHRLSSNHEGGTMPDVHPDTPSGGNSNPQLAQSSREGPPPQEEVIQPTPGAANNADHLSEELAAMRNSIQTLASTVSDLAMRIADYEEPRTIQGMGQAPRTPALYGGFSGLDRVEMAVDALLTGTRPPDGVRPLTGIRELYMLLSGDYELTGRFHPDRVYLANVTTSTMAGLVANRLNKVVVNMFQQYDQWWAPGVTVRDFATLQDVRWITLGGVGELPTVAEGAQYTEMTWDDQTETDSFVKKDGYLGITLETIDKDDTGRVMAAPRALAQAAWLTLGKAIAEVFTANSGYGPAMSDSNYLFDSSNHSNQGSTALSFSAWETTKIAMMKYTEVNSSERLGALTRPRLLWVPIDLENTAIEILAAGEGHPNDADYRVNAEAMATDLMARLNSARNRVITVPFWTDTADWVAQANPAMYPGLGLGFRYGRTPEIFSVADPRAGLMFTNDTMPIKVRFFFAVGPTDWRAWYKHLVS